jgi:hypothetical protein
MNGEEYQGFEVGTGYDLQIEGWVETDIAPASALKMWETTNPNAIRNLDGVFKWNGIAMLQFNVYCVFVSHKCLLASRTNTTLARELQVEFNLGDRDFRIIQAWV